MCTRVAMSRCHAKRVPRMSLVPSWLGQGAGDRGLDGGRLSFELAGRVLAASWSGRPAAGWSNCQHGMVEKWVEEESRWRARAKAQARASGSASVGWHS